MVILSSVQGHTGLTHTLYFRHSSTLALSPERQSARMSKIKKSGLDQYGAERFGRLVFATIRKSVRLHERVKRLLEAYYFRLLTSN